MKKWIAIFLCLVMLCPVLAGCANENEPAETLDPKYQDLWYLEREECRFDLSDKKKADNALGFEGILNTGKPIQTSYEGKLLAVALMNNMLSRGDVYQDYYPAFVEHSTKDNIWIFCFSTTKLALGDTMLILAVDGNNRNLITLW